MSAQAKNGSIPPSPINPSSKGTLLNMQHSGWGVEDDWGEARAYFESAWDVVMDRLVQRFEKGPFAWEGSSSGDSV